MHSELSCYPPKQTCNYKMLYVSLTVTTEPKPTAQSQKASGLSPLGVGLPAGFSCAAATVMRVFPLHLLCQESVSRKEMELFLIERVTLTCFHDTMRSRHTACPRLWTTSGNTAPPQPSSDQRGSGSRGAFVRFSTHLCLPTPRGPVQHRKLEPILM